MKKWNVQTNSALPGDYIGTLELESGEYFEIVKTWDFKLVFGNATNTGLMESGYMQMDTCFSLDENLQELLADLETYYRDGKDYVSDIICNDKM